MEQNMVLKLMRVREGAIIPKQATAGSAGYDLCVRRRFCGAEHLHAELMQLAQTACLRLFVAVAGGLIVELYRVTAVI